MAESEGELGAGVAQLHEMVRLDDGIPRWTDLGDTSSFALSRSYLCARITITHPHRSLSAANVY